MREKKRPSDMQRLAGAFHFTKEDLLLNRQGTFSELQRKRQWRRFWTGVTLLIVIFGLGGVFLAFFLWGTAPDGTFPFLPPNTGTEDAQLFRFAQIGGALFVLVMLLAALGLVNAAARIRGAEVFIYRGRIRVMGGYDNNRLQLIDDGRGFDIDDAQYKLIEPLVDQHPFAVYYLKTRDGILSLEPI